MNLDARDVATSAIVAFVAGLAIWPPGAVYWTEVAGEVGGGPTLAVVGAVAVLAGAAFEYLAGVDLSSFALGTAVAYALGMVLVEVSIAPGSPVHIVWYALLAICLFVGATSVVVYRRGEVELYPVDWA